MSTMDEKEIKCSISYDKDTRRHHRYLVKSPDGIVGSVYIPRDMDPIPDVIVLEKHRDDENGDH